MNEQARIDAYEIFKTGGYNGTQDEFIELINTNKDAFTDSLSMFREGGYTGQGKDYVELLGLEISSEETGDGEKKKEVPTRLDLKEDEVVETTQDVKDKYEDYISYLKQEENGVATQTIALDRNGNPLKGLELEKKIQEVEKEYNDLLKLVASKEEGVIAAQDYAQKKRDILKEIIPTEEEILAQAEQHQGSGFKPIATFDDSEEKKKDPFKEADRIAGFKPNPLFTALEKDKHGGWVGDKDDNQSNFNNVLYHSLPIKEERDKWEEVESVGVNVSNNPNLKKRAEENKAVAKKRREQKDAIDYKNYSQLILNLQKGAPIAGYSGTTNDKSKADKSKKTNKPLLYIPDLNEFKKDPTVIYDIDKSDKLMNAVRYQLTQEAIVDSRYNSDYIQKKLAKIDEEFEDEHGTAWWGNIIKTSKTIADYNIQGKIIGAASLIEGLEKTLGVGTEREAIKSKEAMASYLGLSQKGTDYQIASTMFDLREEAASLMVQQTTVAELARELKNKDNITQAEIDNYNNLRESLVYKQDVILADYEYLGTLEFSGANLEDVMKKTVKTYDEFQTLSNIFENSAIRIVTGLGTLANEMNAVNIFEHAGIEFRDENGEANEDLINRNREILGDGLGADIVETYIRGNVWVDQTGDDLLSKSYKYGEGLLEQNRTAQGFGDISNAMEALTWGTEMLTGQLLNTGLSIVIPGSGGLILAAASEAGNQMHEMKTRMEGEEWSESEKKYIKEFKDEWGFNPLGDDDTYKVKPEEYNALQFYGTAALYGAAEYLSEKITLGNFKMGAKNIRKAIDLSKGAKKGLTRSNKINQRWINLKETGKDFATGMPGESLGEGGVTITQNFAEKYILGNKDVSLLDGVTEAMVSGAVMSGTMQAPGIMAQTYQAFRGPDRNAKIAQRGADIQTLSNSIKNKQLQLTSLDINDSKHKEIREAIAIEETQLHELAKEQLKDQQSIRSEILTLTKGDRETLIKIFNKEHSLRAEMDKVNSNTQITKEAATSKMNELETQLLQQEAIKNYTLGNAEWNADKTRSATFANNWRVKSGTLDQVETVLADNNKEAMQAGLDYIDTRDNLTTEEKNQVKEQMKMQFDAADKASRGDSTVNGMAWGDNITVETTNPDQSKSKRIVQVPMTFALNKDNLTVRSHEIGHHTLFKEFMRDNPDAVGLVQDLESYVKKNYPEAYKNFLETKELYGQYDSKGELSNQAAVAEEKLARLSDFMRQNNLEGMRSLQNKLFGRFKKFNDGSGQIQTGKDVFDMLTSFNQSFERGTLTGLASKVAEGTAEVSRKKKGVKKETIDKDTKMKKSLKDSSAKKSLTKAEKAELTDLTNEAPGPKGKDGKYQMTKKEFLNDKNKAFTKVYTAISQGKFDGLIIDKLESGKDIHGETRESIIQQVRDKLADHLMNFDPNQNNSLFGWMNSYIGKRVGDVTGKAKRKKLPGTKISTDQTIGEQGRTVAETLADDTDIDQQLDQDIVEDTIDNMRTKLGIEKGGPIYNKVLDSVRKVLGTKLPEVTNKKFKEDLKKAFDKELFKEIKKFIGTRAKYEAFLNENFETVFNSISQSTANKRFRPFVEPLIDPATGKQARPDNNPLFRKRDVSKAEFMEYFLGKDVGASTKGTRKDALAGAIAQELAFDATMEVLDDPAVQNRIKDIYELQGLRQAENYTAVVGKNIDRVPGSKFSRTKNTGVKPIDVNPTDTSKDVKTKVKDLVYKLEKHLADDTGVLSGRDLLDIMEDFNNSLTSLEQLALKPLMEVIEEIYTVQTLDIDSLAAYDFAATVRDTIDGKIDFQSFGDVDIDKNFNKWIDSQIQGKDNKRKKPYTLSGRSNPLTDIQVNELFEGHEDLGNFLPDDLKNNTAILQALAGSNNVRTESKIKSGGTKSITNTEVSKALNKNGNNKKSGVSNPNVTTAGWKNISKKVDEFINNPNFDPKNPNDVKALQELVNKLYPPTKAKEIQEVGEKLLNSLNEMVNQYSPFSVNWWKAFNYAQNIIAQQTNSTTGIFRQMANINAVSLLSSKATTPFQIEHNLMNSKFVYNALSYIFKEAQGKVKGDKFSFKDNISKLSNVFSRNMMLLDKDIQAIADSSPTSKDFNKKLDIIKKKYPDIDFDARIPQIKAIMGRTKLQEGFDPNMDTLVNNILAFGIADKVLHMPSGLTYAQVLLNHMQGKLAFDVVTELANNLRKSFDKSTMGKVILKDKNTSKVLSENATANALFNNMLISATQLYVDPNAETNIDNQSIELGLRVNFSKSYNSKNEANSELMNNSGVTNKFSKSKNTTQEVIDESTVMDKALNIARDPNAPIKKIRVFDFDDTLARTKSNVLYTMPDGTTGKLTAEDFAKQGDSILEQGGKFDFSEFNKVMEGKKGPLFEVAKKIQDARGTQDVFVLTARAQEAGPAIKQFLDSLGLNIPQQNITGLGNSSPLAKSNWIVDKAAEGYNDFYFADDATQNVAAVKKVLDVIDVKSNVQQAKIKFSKTVDQTVNDIIEHKFGIKSEAEYSDVKARLVGRKKGRFKFFVPPSAEDFVGLLYSMLGKGEVGDMQMEWFKEHLIEPYGRAMENISRDQNRMVNDFKVLKDQLVKEGLIPKNLNKKAVDGFTYQDVARVLAWHKQGLDIPGISKSDLSSILKFAKDNPAIDVFAQNLIDINKGDGYAKPGKDWLAGTISTDLLDGLRTGKRSKYLQQWKQNVDIIFSNKNLNKMEAAMGSKWREAMENMLDRMESGRNRSSKAGRLENQVLDYINNSVGTVMFLNMRSALLQTISAINFVNWGSNNILKAGAAFANQPQYWKDFMELMNSEFLVERRNGLKLNVSESEIADAAATSKNKAKAAISYILKKGYLPTQFADSFAIASGGATFYRNRLNELIKDGMPEADAKKQAFLEFREIAEESQQSSRPDRISQQQASSLGRIILAFANTPMQYNRIIKKAASDVINGRGDTKSNVSKMVYYAAIQNIIFNSLQQALFALAFDDEEEEKTKQKYYNVANGMLDSILRGSGIAGTAVSTLLAVTRKALKEAEKDGTFPGPNYDAAAFELLNFSPPIDIKVSKLRYAGNNWKYEGWKHDDANWGIDDPAWTSAAYVISSLTNIPVDRLLKKMDNVQGALNANEDAWKRVAMALGWSKWQLKTSEQITSHRAEEKPLKREALKRMHGEDKPEVYNKDEQEVILKKHGYSDEEIKAMKKEEDRVAAILRKQKETGKVYKPQSNRKYLYKPVTSIKQTEKEKKEAAKQLKLKQEKEKTEKQRTKYKGLKKPEQVHMLDSLGLSKKEIRELQYEKDRVAKLMELMNK